MDPQRLKNAWQHLQSLDERLTYKVRPKTGGALTRPDPDRLEHQLRDLANYTVELKEIVGELILAIGTRPKEGTGKG
ncbi:MAG TPA: hypothetical protein VHQ65_09920 [Thermoanaerobaculia bacterium]|nr:hypothetical protein [Thermoanaerobaculia bacterium]